MMRDADRDVLLDMNDSIHELLANPKDHEAKIRSLFLQGYKILANVKAKGGKAIANAQQAE